MMKHRLESPTAAILTGIGIGIFVLALAGLALGMATHIINVISF